MTKYLMTWAAEAPGWEPDQGVPEDGYIVITHSEVYEAHEAVKERFAGLLEELPMYLPFPMVFKVSPDGTVRDLDDDEYDELGSL